MHVDTFLFVPPLSVLPVCTLSKYQKRACCVRSSRCARGRNVRIAPTPPHPNSVEKVMLQKTAFHSYGSRAVGRRFNYVRFLFLNMCVKNAGSSSAFTTRNKNIMFFHMPREINTCRTNPSLRTILQIP